MFEYHSERSNNFVIFKIHATFKDRLLDLFSFMNKAFKLYINYTLEKDQKYTVTFVTPVPILDNLDDYCPNKKFLGVFMPEEVNKPLIRLFNNGFYLNKNFTDIELDLQRKLT